MLTVDDVISPYDPRNNSVGLYEDEKWKTVFHDTDSIAKGTWSSTKDDPSAMAGFRRYGAGKLCEIMMMYVSLLTHVEFCTACPSQALSLSSSLIAFGARTGTIFRDV